jgi:3-phenylpropionate/trans-cinnamate dioxygenase ferredoxin reductase component
MRCVIVGAGLAGGNAAAGARESGYDGEIVLLGNEPGVPFGRPPLSKTYLRGEEDLSGWLVKSDEWYEENGVMCDTSARVERIETADRRVVVADGRTIDYDHLVVATGCRPRLSRIEGIDLDGVMPLRTKAQCDAIRERVAAKDQRVAVVGMSFIGSEVAASLRQIGCDVTAVFPGPGPLSAVLGDEVAARMSHIHTEQGVELVSGEKVSAFSGDGRVEAVVTESGRTVECDMAVVGLGVDPNVDVLDGSGIAVDNGVLVDGSCRTDADGVFAAGDVANQDHPLFGRIRVEHYNNAEKQGRHVGSHLLDPEPYDYVHTFWSDQYDHKLEYVGFARKWDRFVARGDFTGGGFIGFYLKDGVVLAAMGLDRGGDPEAEPDSELAACVTLIRERTRVDPELLARESTDLLEAAQA